MGIDVKKKVESRHNNQAILKMLLVNVASQYPVIMLLTDLRYVWRYFWLRKGTIAFKQFDLAHGIAFMDYIAGSPTSGSPTIDVSAMLEITSSHAPALGACNLQAAISDDDNDIAGSPTSRSPKTHVPAMPWITSPRLGACKLQAAISDEHDNDEGLTEGGIEEVLKTKIDVMTLLPESDIARMDDFFDVMSASEIREWKYRLILNYFMRTPAFQSSITGTGCGGDYA